MIQLPVCWSSLKLRYGIVLYTKAKQQVLEAMTQPKLLIVNQLVSVLELLDISLVHSDANKNKRSRDSINIECNSDAGQSRKLKLTESGQNTGIFKGLLKLTPNKSKSSKELQVAPGDILSFVYDTAQLKHLPSTYPHRTISKAVEVKTFDPEFISNKDSYKVNDQVTIQVADPSSAWNPFVNDVVSAQALSDSDHKGINIFFKETKPDSKVFQTSFKLGPTKSKSSLMVKDGDMVSIEYFSRYPADWEEYRNGEYFTFSFSVGIPRYADMPVELKLARMQRYFDLQLVQRMNHGDSLFWLKNKRLTVVFWDIRQFSELCEVLKGQDVLLRGFLKEYFSLASIVIYENDGVLDKFIGDGVMALFGVFATPANVHAIKAVKTALDFRQGFENILAKWIPKWGLEVADKINISLGCGINTGEVMVGNFDSQERDQFTAIGRNVNIASRLEKKADKMQILISETTKNMIQKRFQLRHLGVITKGDMKNIQSDFDYYEVFKEN